MFLIIHVLFNVLTYFSKHNAKSILYLTPTIDNIVKIILKTH